MAGYESDTGIFIQINSLLCFIALDVDKDYAKKYA